MISLSLLLCVKPTNQWRALTDCIQHVVGHTLCLCYSLRAPAGSNALPADEHLLLSQCAADRVRCSFGDRILVLLGPHVMVWHARLAFTPSYVQRLLVGESG